MNGRCQGKSRAMKLAAEAALDSGKTVLFAGSNGSTLKRRKKHLTLMEFLPKKEAPPTVIYDDYRLPFGQ